MPLVCGDFGLGMFDAVDRQIQLVVMVLGLAAELGAPVSQDT